MTNRGSVFRGVLATCLVFWVVFFVDWPATLGAFTLMHVVIIIMVQPLQLLIIFLSSVRFAVLAQGSLSQIYKFYQAYLLSVGLNTFVPGRLSEFIKISYLKEKAGIAGSASLAAMFLEKIADVFMLGLVILLGLGSVWMGINEKLIMLVTAVAMAIIVLLPSIEKVTPVILEKLPGKKFHSIFRSAISEAVARVQGRDFLIAVGVSVIIWFGTFLQVWIVLKVLHGASLDIGEAVLIYSAMILGRAIPGLPGGIGTFEAAVVYAMTQIGFDFSVSLTTALTLHGSQLLIVTAISLVVLVRDGTGVKSIITSARKLNASDTGT